MPLLKIAFFGVLALLAAVGIFLGVVVLLTSLQNGAIMLSYGQGGGAVDETVTRSANPDRFWRLLGVMGVLPALAGAGVLWLTVRKLRRS